MKPASDWTIDQDWAQYSPDEHAVWRHLFDRQSRLLAGRACDEYLAGLQALHMIRLAHGNGIGGIIISADRKSELQTQIREHGFGYVSKPVKPLKLRALMNSLLLCVNSAKSMPMKRVPLKSMRQSLRP